MSLAGTSATEGVVEPEMAPHEQQDPVLLLLATSVAAVVALASLLSVLRNRRRYNLPPSPPGVPVFGNLGVFVSTSLPHQKITQLAHKYGPIMSLKLGAKLAIVVTSPEMAKEVFKNYDKEFADRPQSTFKEAACYGDLCMPLLEYGPNWRNLRKIVTLELLTAKRIQQFERVRREEVSGIIRSILEDNRNGEHVDMDKKSTYVIMNIATRILMSKRFYAYSKESRELQAAGREMDRFLITFHRNHAEKKNQTEDLSDEFKRLVSEVASLASIPLIGDVIPYLGFLDRVQNRKGKMVKVHNRYDSFLDGILKEHRETRAAHVGEPRDFVDVLLDLPQEPGEKERVRDDRIKALVMDMINAGVHSTSLCLEWAMAELIRNPGVMEKLQAEIDGIVGRDRQVTEADVAHASYLHAFLKEVLRLHPPGPLAIPRQSNEWCKVAGYDIPPNTQLFLNVWGICRDPTVWPDPLHFQPERFLTSDIDFKGHHYEFLPFGTGRRGCPGMNMALILLSYTLARLVHSFDWALPDGQKPQDLDMSEKFELALPRAQPLIVVPTPRLPHHLY